MTWPTNNPGYPGTMSGAGAPGPAGPEGESGADATIAIGDVTSVPYGTPPTVTNVGTPGAAVLDFELETGPAGAAGSNGTNGIDGADGADGVGVPAGGSEGEVLKKHSNSDYDTEWGVAASGGHTIQDETTPMTARANLNFTGAGVTVTDDEANVRTVVTIPGGGSGGGSFLVSQVFS